MEALDSYLHKQAAQDLKKRTSVPFVISPDGKVVAGYYTLSQYAVELDVIPQEFSRTLPKYPMVPVTLLGRLAVSQHFRGSGLGERLLMDALYRSLRSSREVASVAVIVDAKDVSATAFYKKYGFIELPGVKQRLFLPMRTIEQMFQGNQINAVSRRKDPPGAGRVRNGQG